MKDTHTRWNGIETAEAAQIEGGGLPAVVAVIALVAAALADCSAGCTQGCHDAHRDGANY